MSIYDELGDMLEILDDFVVETHELVDQLNQDLLLIEGGQDPDAINRIFRAFHTIKGTSGFLSFDHCMDLAHAAEDLLIKVRNLELEPSTEVVDVLLDTTDWFRMFIQDVETRTEQNYDTSDIQRSISSLLDQPSVPNLKSPELATSAPLAQAENDKPRIVEGLPQDLIEAFIQESHEMIETVGNEIMSLEIEPENLDIINEVFRVFHTLKGNSGLIGLNQMSDLTHKAEDVLGAFREKKIEINAILVDTLLSVVDYVRIVLDEIRKDDLQERDTSELMKNLCNILGEPVFDPASWESGDQAPEAEPSEKAGYKAAKAGDAPKRIEQTIRVDVDRLDNLMNVAGELVLEKNRLSQLSQRIKQLQPELAALDDLDGVNHALGYITTEIQERVMQMRMLPISNVFRKFPRLVRDLAKEKHKEIELVIRGEDTELDRSLIEAIGDPLIHLLRNAIDHGIELPGERIKKEKPGVGTILLEATQEGNQIVIKIQDDGAGIDAEKILSKGVEKGLISQDEADLLSPAEILNLILKPGFSTAEKVTDVSGRGVGMDVVSTNINRLNGRLEIDSKLGAGSIFTLRLPLTLTIIRGMVIKVWDETYIIPVNNISETLRLDPGEMGTVNASQVINVRNSVIPALNLEELLNVVPQGTEKRYKYAVIVSQGDSSMGLIVSSLLGQEETVVKPLGKALGSIKYLAGATLRGDGKVSLILDVAQLFETVNIARRALA